MVIHAIVPGSRVNGPGVRVLIYFQGCTLACRSCWNPETQGEEQSICDLKHKVAVIATLCFRSPPRTLREHRFTSGAYTRRVAWDFVY